MGIETPLQSEAVLLRRIDELLEANTAEVERRRAAEAKISVIYEALDAAEYAAAITGVSSPEGEPAPRRLCGCSTCIVVRGIRAFVERK